MTFSPPCDLRAHQDPLFPDHPLKQSSLSEDLGLGGLLEAPLQMAPGPNTVLVGESSFQSISWSSVKWGMNTY